MSNLSADQSANREPTYSSATCACCGMVTSGPKEFHPYAACLMFKACNNGDTVRANLAFVIQHGRELERRS